MDKITNYEWVGIERNSTEGMQNFPFFTNATENYIQY